MKQKNITVGIIIDTAFKIPPDTGVTYRLYYLSKKLAQKGIRIKIFLCNRIFFSDKQVKALLKEKSLEFHIIPEYVFYNTIKLEKIIKKARINILQVEDAVSVVRYEIIAKNLNIPIYLEMHDVEATLLEKLNYSKKQVISSKKLSYLACTISEKIICMTPLDRHELINKIKANTKKISLIPNPINLNDFPYYGPNLKEKNIIFLGNMFYWPNQNATKFIAKKIYSQVYKKNNKIKFTLIGMVPEKIKNMFNKKNLFFPGSITGKNLNQLLSKSTLALCPVLEGSGMKVKILNYCAAGLPIITTRIGASGYEKISSLIIEDDLKEYPKLIIDLLNNPNKMKQLGKRNRFFIERYYNLNKLVDKTIKTYQETIKNYSNRKRENEIKNRKKIPLPLWLKEKRIKMNKNKKYYLIRNGEIIIEKDFDETT